MSRPRKPFGSNHPGRLPSTLMKVLAAEMSDPGRLRRGKQYAKDGSVLDIVIEPGVVTAEIQGSRPTPYVASIFVRGGDGMPLRRDIDVECSCPDDDNWDDYACKHALAAMLVLADEFLLEPELLDVWRGRAGAAERHGRDDDGSDEHADVDEPDHDEFDDHDAFDDEELGEPYDGFDDDRPDNVVPIRPSLRLPPRRRRPQPPERREPEPPRGDPLAPLLQIPAGAPLPDIPALHSETAPLLPNRPELARIVRDALHHATAGWE